MVATYSREPEVGSRRYESLLEIRLRTSAFGLPTYYLQTYSLENEMIIAIVFILLTYQLTF